jgi:beta-glucosidase
MLEATRQFVLSAMGSTGKPSSIDVEDVLSKLSTEEKIGLVSGIDFWHTFPVHRLGIPTIRVSDGPNGVRGTRFFNGVPAACLPCGESYLHLSRNHMY